MVMPEHSHGHAGCAQRRSQGTRESLPGPGRPRAGARLRQTRWVLGALVAVLAAAFAGLPADGAAQENVLRIGAALPLTGGLVHEGKLQRDGYELWKDAVNERGGITIGGKKYRVEIKYYDYKSDTPTSARLVEKLITEDGIRFIFGPFGSGATTASSAITERYRAILMAPSASAEEVYSRGYKYLFGILVPSSVTWEDLFDLLLKQNPKPRTVAIVARNDLFPLSVGNAAKKSADKRGLKVVYFEKYPIGATDFSSLLIQVKNLQPDIFVGTGYTQDLILLTKQARELHVAARIMTQTAGPAYQDFTDALKDTANYVVTPVWWTTTLTWKGPVLGTAVDYTRLFERKFRYTPDYVTAASSACGVVLQLAIEKAGSLDPEKVREVLARTSFTTFYGPIEFGPNGQNHGTKISVVQILSQKREIILPADIATAKLRYPAPPWDKR